MVMPFSGWIQGDDVDGLPFRRIISYPAESVSAFTDVAFWLGGGVPWNAAQWRAAPATNPFLPSFFDDLERGVDYDLIPDAGFTFVEYEAPAGYVHHWTWDNGPPLIDSIVATPGSGVLRLLSPTDYDDVDQFPFIPGLQADGIPQEDPAPGGIQFATFSGLEPDGTTLPTPPNPGAASAFTIVAELDFPLDGDGVEDRVYLRIPRDPIAWTRPPRFRYWIPTPARRLALQWAGRSDGLGREGVTPWRADPATNQWRPTL